jgi:hypothetical protein
MSADVPTRSVQPENPTRRSAPKTGHGGRRILRAALVAAWRWLVEGLIWAGASYGDGAYFVQTFPLTATSLRRLGEGVQRPPSSVDGGRTPPPLPTSRQGTER